MSATPFISSTRLADHVRACRIGDQMIFLDLLRSRYFGVAGPHLAALCAVICEGAGSADTVGTPSDPLLQASISRLRAQKLLSDAPAKGPTRQPPAFTEAVTSLNTHDAREIAGADWRNLFRLWRATLVATTWLRRRSLADIADRVSALRMRHSTPTAEVSGDAMLAAVACYVRLRPFALTSRDRCLNDSLTLIHFLATQGLFPQWVIGVRVHPFGAHSWAQSGGVVLNDLAERVRHFRPILVV
jgi:hypothetical protein